MLQSNYGVWQTLVCVGMVGVSQQSILVYQANQLKQVRQSKARKQQHAQTWHVDLPAVHTTRCSAARGCKQSQISAAKDGGPDRTCRARRTACATSSAVCCCAWSAGRPSITTAACLLMSCMMPSWTLPECTPCPGSCNVASLLNTAKHDPQLSDKCGW